MGAKTWPCYNQNRVITSSVTKGLKCTCVFDHIDLMLPFCCCCGENGGCLVHYPVTKCLVKGMSQCSQDATFSVFGNGMSSIVKSEAEFYIP